MSQDETEKLEDQPPAGEWRPDEPSARLKPEDQPPAGEWRPDERLRARLSRAHGAVAGGARTANGGGAAIHGRVHG